MNPPRPADTTFLSRPRALLGRLVQAAVVLLVTMLALQQAVAQPVDLDPPGRVARLSELSGNVWVYHPDAGDWVQATLNLPLTTGDTLATEPGARAELQIGSSLLRLDAGSELQVGVLDERRISLQLRAGALAVRVRNLAETGPFEVDTDEGRFLVQSAGRYRFDRGTSASFATVDAGQVRFEYTSSALSVTAGQRAEFWIDANGTAQYTLGGLTYDAFTAWNNERDRATERSGSVAARYVSPEMTGAQDLDRYGSWEPNPEYGAVWIPATVPVDWAPYSTGHWAWVRPWGWTWIDDAPWGFAPFHYGRWVNLRNRWCWTPGIREPRPIYAPALVGWVGPPRGGVSISVGIGPAVGWFPLAPREVFVPAYRSSPRYIRDLNQPYLRRGDISLEAVIRDPQMPREFENRRFPQAVTVVPASAFAERRSIAPVAAQYRNAPWARDFARSNGPAPFLTAPPVPTPPAVLSRQADAQPSRPPPGFAPQRTSGPGRAPRDRDGSRSEPLSPATADGGRMPPDRQRPPGGGGEPPDRFGRPDRNAATSPPGNAPAVQSPLPGDRAGVAPAEAGMPARVRPLPVRPGVSPGEPPNGPGAPEARSPAAGATLPSPRVPATPSTEAQEPPRMRPFPIVRGSERRDEAPAPLPARRPGDLPAGIEREAERLPGQRPGERSPSQAERQPAPAERPPVQRAPQPTREAQPPQREPQPTREAQPTQREPQPTRDLQPTQREPQPTQPARQPPTQPVRPDAPAPRPEGGAPRPPEPVQAPGPRTGDAQNPPRRVEGPRPAAPSAEPPRAPAPERRNDPNASR